MISLVLFFRKPGVTAAGSGPRQIYCFFKKYSLPSAMFTALGKKKLFSFFF
jgi:hypothetical protein